MRIHVVAVGKRQPEWVDEGFHDYARRLRGSCVLELTEISPGRRTKTSSVEKARHEEGERMLRLVPPNAHVVALSISAPAWSTAQLAARLRTWAGLRTPVFMLIGGADGLSAECESRAVERWSLSPLTFPHGLVRVILAEALYRAWSSNEGHPYHRA